MKLIEFYTKSCEAMGIFKDADDRLHASILKSAELTDANLLKVSIKKGGTKSLLTVALPTASILKLSEDGTLAKFNPMAENVLSLSQSEMQKKLLLCASGRIVVSFTAAYNALLEIALDASTHDDLNPTIFEIIRTLPVFDKPRTIERVRKYAVAVMAKTTGFVGTKAICRFKHLKGATLGGEVFPRATVLIPVLGQIMEKDEPPFGIKPPNANAELLVRGIVKAIFSTFEGAAGTAELVAPYYRTSLLAFNDVAKGLNELHILSGLSKSDDMVIDLSWFRHMDILPEAYVKELNFRFPGNVGPMSEEDDVPPFEADPVVTSETIVAECVTDKEVIAQSVPVENQPVSEPMKVAPIKLATMANIAVNATQQFEKPQEMRASVPVVNNPNLAKSVVQVEAAPMPKVRTVAPVVATRTVANKSSVQIERAPTQTAQPVQANTNQVALYDIQGQPLMLASGYPYMVNKDQVPDIQVQQKRSASNHPLFNSDGTPTLVEAQQGNTARHNHFQAPAQNMSPQEAWKHQQMITAQQQSAAVQYNTQQSPAQYSPYQQAQPAMVPQQMPRYAPQQNMAPQYNPYSQKPQQYSGSSVQTLAPNINYHK